MCFCFENLELKRLFSFLLINRPKDAREAHVGPGAFYVDNVNGKTEVCIFSLKENYESVRKLKRPETFPEKMWLTERNLLPRSTQLWCPFLKTQLDSSLSLIISLIIPATETSLKKRILAQKAAHQPTAIILPLRRVLKSPWMLGESLKSSWILNVIGSKEYFFAILKTGRQNLFKRKQLFNILDEISSAGGLLGKLNYTSFYPTNLPTPHLLDHFCRTFSSHPTLS